MGYLPLSLEVLEFFVVFPVPVKIFVVFFEFGNSFVFNDHFLEMAPTLSCSPFSEIFSKCSENLRGSMIRKEVLSLVLGDEDVLIIVDEQNEPEVLLLVPPSLIPFSVLDQLVLLRKDR